MGKASDCVDVVEIGKWGSSLGCMWLLTFRVVNGVVYICYQEDGESVGILQPWKTKSLKCRVAGRTEVLLCSLEGSRFRFRA